MIQQNISFVKYIFKDKLKSAVVKKDNQSMSLQINRNIIDALLSYSAKSGGATDFERALKVPLPAVTLSIANRDANHRETSKSKLMDVINAKRNENFAQVPSENISDFVIDFIALVRTWTITPKAFANLIWKIINILPVGCITLHVVADSYR